LVVTTEREKKVRKGQVPQHPARRVQVIREAKKKKSPLTLLGWV